MYIVTKGKYEYPEEMPVFSTPTKELLEGRTEKTVGKPKEFQDHLLLDAMLLFHKLDDAERWDWVKLEADKDR